MALLARVFVVIFSFLLACVAAAMVVTFAFLLPGWTALTDVPATHQGLAVAIGFSAVFFSVYAMVPAMLVIAVAEGFRLRSILLYALAGGALALLATFGWDLRGLAHVGADDGTGHVREIMAGAGIVGGFVYWALAGRSAGRWRKPPAGAGPDVFPGRGAAP